MVSTRKQRQHLDELPLESYLIQKNLSKNCYFKYRIVVVDTQEIKTQFKLKTISERNG